MKNTKSFIVDISWHSIMLSKYLPLVDVIRISGWSVDLFAIEVVPGVIVQG